MELEEIRVYFIFCFQAENLEAIITMMGKIHQTDVTALLLI